MTFVFFTLSIFVTLSLVINSSSAVCQLTTALLSAYLIMLTIFPLL